MNRNFSRLYGAWIVCSIGAFLLFVVGLWLAVTPYIEMMSKLVATADTPTESREIAPDVSRVLIGGALLLASLILSVIGFVAWAMLFCRAWSVAHPKYLTTTPQTALLLLFVPLFNVYWMFVVTTRLAGGLNRMAADRGIHDKQVPSLLGVAACVLSLTTLLLGGWNVSPYWYLAASIAASLTLAIFFYYVQRAAGRMAISGEQPLGAANL